MFQLYKKRTFSDYISDTIAFFKQYGRSYFKSYITINGGLLLVLSFLMYFFFKVYFEVIFSSMGAPNSAYLEEYFGSNALLFFSSFFVFMVLIILISMINYAYPVLFLKLLSQNPKGEFSTKEIVNHLLKNMGRLLLFILGLAFIIMPLIMIAFFILILMCFIIIGIPLVFIALPTILTWINLSFYDYLSEKSGFFEAFKNGYYMVKSQFWTIIGTTFVMLLLIQVIQGVLTMIPYVIGIFYFFTSDSVPGWQTNPEEMASLGIFGAVFMVLGILVSFIFNNFFFINQGLIYYSLQEENEGTSAFDEIDLIGANDE